MRNVAKSRAKESGRNRFRLFADQMNEGVAEKLTLESSLHAALEKRQLYLEFPTGDRYQDRSSDSGGSAASMEAS